MTKHSIQVVTVGNEGEVAAFLSWQDPQPFYVNFVGVSISTIFTMMKAMNRLIQIAVIFKK